MLLTPATRLGSYEIIALLGAGGMGEFYRARDTRLKREIAIKVLPDGFASSPRRLVRPPSFSLGHFEAWLAFQLAPQHPRNVRRWGLLLAEQRRYERAVELLERYLAGGNDDPGTRAQIQRQVTEIRRQLTGGDLAGEQLRVRTSR